ncbi:hypothetical protein CLV96_3938 [Leptospira meyeri]|uniref:Uncharacterized protein n=1 Tax=Leptospira meyeri TaxID=29508 RepID=A0A4R8MIS3_LEPME|nr:hypothetical protein CLV96_3938 [Leptospira meyeri]
MEELSKILLRKSRYKKPLRITAGKRFAAALTALLGLRHIVLRHASRSARRRADANASYGGSATDNVVSPNSLYASCKFFV